MSLDYPYYQELCRRKHRAAWWWLAGDRLYYLGALPAMPAAPGTLAGLGAGLLGYGWHWLAISAIALTVGVIVAMLGSSLKLHAYRLAERDGITQADAYRNSAARQSADSPPDSPP